MDGMDMIREAKHDNNAKKRFYELDELENLNASLNRTDNVKIFICNFCHQWNRVNADELISSDDMKKKRKKEKKVIHVEITPEFKIIWDKFRANFGSNERAMIVALSDFYKHNRSS
jgi:DNA-directed RNA polymerase delta subunit